MTDDLQSLSREALAAKLDRVAHWMRHEDYTLDSNATERDLREAARRLRATCRWKGPSRRGGMDYWLPSCGQEHDTSWISLNPAMIHYCPFCAGALVEARGETSDGN